MRTGRSCGGISACLCVSVHDGSGRPAHRGLHTMNTRSSSLRRLLTMSWLALGFLFAGCDFSHPYGEPSGAAIDPALLGSWIEADPEPGKGAGALEITAVSQSEYLVQYSGQIFRAWRVSESPDNFLQLRLRSTNSNEPLSRSFMFCIFSFDDGELVVHRVRRPKEPETLSTAAAVRAWVARAMQDETPEGLTYRFARRPASPDTAKP